MTLFAVQLLADLSTLADRGEWDTEKEWTPDSEVNTEVPKGPEKEARKRRPSFRYSDEVKDFILEMMLKKRSWDVVRDQLKQKFGLDKNITAIIGSARYWKSTEPERVARIGQMLLARGQEIPFSKVSQITPPAVKRVANDIYGSDEYGEWEGECGGDEMYDFKELCPETLGGEWEPSTQVRRRSTSKRKRVVQTGSHRPLEPVSANKKAKPVLPVVKFTHAPVDTENAPNKLRVPIGIDLTGKKMTVGGRVSSFGREVSS